MNNSKIVNDREYKAQLDFDEELSFLKDKNYLFVLDYLSSLQVVGDQASEFLQGQISCDLRQVSEQKIQQGALCNLKGRILALLDVIQWHGLRLILPMDLVQETQKSLAMSAMLAKVQLRLNKNLRIYGFYLQNKSDLQLDSISLPSEPYEVLSHEDYCCYSLGQGFYLILLNHDHFIEEAFLAKKQLRGSLGWHALQLSNKHIEIYPNTRGIFLPHRLELHLSGYLNFNKGCYKGQEIIARTHYRAKLKHGLRVFNIKTNEPLCAGKKLFDLEGKIELGELIDICPLSNNQYLIAASILFDDYSEVIIEPSIKPILLEDACI